MPQEYSLTPHHICNCPHKASIVPEKNGDSMHTRAIGVCLEVPSSNTRDFFNPVNAQSGTNCFLTRTAVHPVSRNTLTGIPKTLPCANGKFSIFNKSTCNSVNTLANSFFSFLLDATLPNLLLQLRAK